MDRRGLIQEIPGLVERMDVFDRRTYPSVLAKQDRFEIRKIGDFSLFWGLAGVLASGASVVVHLTDNAGPGGTSVFGRRPSVVQVLPDVSSSPSPSGLGSAGGAMYPSQEYKVGLRSGYEFDLEFWNSHHWVVTVRNVALRSRDFAVSAMGV